LRSSPAFFQGFYFLLPARHGTRRLQSFIGFSVQVAVGQVTSHGPSSSCLTAHRSLDFVSKTIEVFA
jgi:hypothetical protein